jgi:hypothetical protein
MMSTLSKGELEKRYVFILGESIADLWFLQLQKQMCAKNTTKMCNRIIVGSGTPGDGSLRMPPSTPRVGALQGSCQRAG